MRRWELGQTMCNIHNVIFPQALIIYQLFNITIAIYCFIKCVIRPTIVFSVKTAHLLSVFIWILASLPSLTIFFSGFVTSVFDHKVLLCLPTSDPTFKTTLLPLYASYIYISLLVASSLYFCIFIKVIFPDLLMLLLNILNVFCWSNL